MICLTANIECPTCRSGIHAEWHDPTLAERASHSRQHTGMCWALSLPGNCSAKTCTGTYSQAGLLIYKHACMP